jgi:hypothetical protein
VSRTEEVDVRTEMKEVRSSAFGLKFVNALLQNMSQTPD